MRKYIVILLCFFGLVSFAQNNSIALSQLRYAAAPGYEIITTTAGRQIYILKDSNDRDTRLTDGWHANDTLYLEVSRVSGSGGWGAIDTVLVYLPLGGVSLNAGTGISITGSGTIPDPYIITNTAPDQTVSLTGAGINVVSGTYPNFTITGTEVDGSVTNEGRLSVSSGGANDALLETNTLGSNAVMFQGSTGIGISETTSSNGGTITITNTEPDQFVTINDGGGIGVSGTYPNFIISAVDQSSTNEIQTLSISNDTVSLSLGGGFVVLPSISGTDTVTYLFQDSILIYFVGGTEFGRDTIRLAAATGDNWGSQVVEIDNTLVGDGTTGNELGVDTSVIATQSDISEMLVNSDTTALLATKFDILDMVEFADTLTVIATKDDIVDIVQFSDTLTTIATQYDLTQLALGEVNTASNLGSGDTIFYQKSGVDLEFKSLVAGDGIGFNTSTSEIEIKRQNVLTPFDTTATAYTFQLIDIDRRIYFTSASDVVVEIPLNATVAFPIGTILTFVRDGAGELDVDIEGGVTLNSAQGYRSINYQYQVAELHKIDTNEWRLIGDLKN